MSSLAFSLVWHDGVLLFFFHTLIAGLATLYIDIDALESVRVRVKTMRVQQGGLRGLFFHVLIAGLATLYINTDALESVRVRVKT